MTFNGAHDDWLAATSFVLHALGLFGTGSAGDAHMTYDGTLTRTVWAVVTGRRGSEM